MNKVQLDQDHISELDAIIGYILDNPERQVYTPEDLSVLNIHEGVTYERSMLYVRVLKSEGLLSSCEDGSAFLVEIEIIKIFHANVGYGGLSTRQKEETLKQEIRDQKQLELTDLQMNQIRLQTKKILTESWWFWVAAAIMLINFVLSLINIF
jgi:hypothetical protein